VVARQCGGDAAAAAEDRAAVAHIGDVELAVLHQRRCCARAAAYTLSTHSTLVRRSSVINLRLLLLQLKLKPGALNYALLSPSMTIL
jgi:hypothetical protein